MKDKEREQKIDEMLKQLEEFRTALADLGIGSKITTSIFEGLAIAEAAIQTQIQISQLWEKKPTLAPIFNDGGITIKQLKELVKDLPEADENGEAYEVWLGERRNSSISNVAKSIWQLNKGDIIIGP